MNRLDYIQFACNMKDACYGDCVKCGKHNKWLFNNCIDAYGTVKVYETTILKLALIHREGLNNGDSNINYRSLF